MGEILDMTRLLAVARKEIIQLRRDSRSLALAFLLPLLLLILFGYAISWDIRDITMGVLDGDRSSASRELIDSFGASGYFTIDQRLESPREIEPLMQRGAVQMVLIIPPDFSANLRSDKTARLQAIVDGSDANTATIVLGYTQAIVQTWSSHVLLDGRTLTLPVTAASRVWYNEELSSRNMIVPGLVAVIMMIIGAMLTSLTIARE
jgi:ABC-2 type transport system permease protein